MRRDLIFQSLDQVVAETESLLATGYQKHGNWSLAQICCHLRLTIESNMHGYPRWMVVLGYPLRPILRWFALPKLLRGKSPKGIPTAGMFVPAADLNDQKEVDEFVKCVEIFSQFDKPLSPHPGFGRMSKTEFDQFHAAHGAHHLSFLQPTMEQGVQVGEE